MAEAAEGLRTTVFAIGPAWGQKEGMTVVFKCPTCGKPAAPLPQNPVFPFCHSRCRSADLGRWLSEEFRIPAESADEIEDEISSGSTESERSRTRPYDA